MIHRFLIGPATVLAIGAALVACRHEPITTSATGSSTPIAVSRSSAPDPVVGEWTRINSCDDFVRAFERAHLRPLLTEWLVAAGYFVREDLVDPAAPCTGAVEDRNSYFFQPSGRFGSLDQDGVIVEDGAYASAGDHTIAIEGKTSGRRFRVRYHIANARIRFRVAMLAACAGECRDDLAWVLSMFYPGELTRST